MQLGKELDKRETRKGNGYNPYTRARGYQLYHKLCSNCGAEFCYERESGHQHWRWSGRDLEDMVEVEGVVYIKCACGGLTRTSLKPMTASIPCTNAVKLGYVSSIERCIQIHRRYMKAKKSSENANSNIPRAKKHPLRGP